MTKEYLDNTKKLFTYYKSLGDKSIAQVEEKRLFWQFNNDSNSVAMIVQHLSGNMLSRFTNFFEEDGEKSWRNRDQEFEAVLTTASEVNEAWEKGWKCFLDLLFSLKEEDLARIVYIRNEGHTVFEAINRQLGHYSYHVGQIVFLSKMVANEQWQSLSIPRNASKDFNAEKFAKDKEKKNFI
jgi:Protein of unknown function (DUF1572)